MTTSARRELEHARDRARIEEIAGRIVRVRDKYRARARAFAIAAVIALVIEREVRRKRHADVAHAAEQRDQLET